MTRCICFLVALVGLSAGVFSRVEAACVTNQPSYTVAVPGRPFAVRELPDSATALVSVNPEKPSQLAGIAVLTCKSGRFAYDRTIPLSPQPTGMALTPDGKLLIVADDSYIVFLRTDRLSGSYSDAVTYVKAERGDIEDEDAGAVYVSVAPDGRYAFVSEEQAGTITVIDVLKAESGSAGSSIIGDIDVGNAPITTLFSSDGKTLYGTIEIAHRKVGYPQVCRPEGASAGDSTRFPPGAVFSLDVASAERASAANLKFAASQCSAVRMALAPGGDFAWVTNRASGTDIPVGSNPVPVAVTRNGRYVLVGITNRFGTGGTTAGHIAVLDGRTNRIIGTIPAGLFPREFSYGSEPTLFLSNNRSDSITVFNEDLIPSIITKIR
jgi:DNA-binding beta-propeller fold protein YncE